MKKNKISKNWINKQRRDIYVRKSKLEGYRSRAIYKLKEIDDKFKIIRNGIKVVDLGSAPGSWSQYLSEKSKNSKILSIDLKDIEKIHNVTHLIGDFLDEKNQTIISNFFKDKLDLIVSDMAVNTTGNKNLDAISTGELSINAMEFSIRNLKKMAVLSQKYLWDPLLMKSLKIVKKTSKKLKVYKPPSSRKDSKESFIICKKIR